MIGASAGGMEHVCNVIGGLRRNFSGTIFVVQHVGDSSLLPELLAKCTTLPVVRPKDAEVIQRGRVYVAPSDHHLKIEDGRMRVDKGPRENRHRPSVDVLFRTASRSYRSRVVAIVLSGALDDGSNGAFVVKERGGLVIVQDPAEARVPDMPRNTMRSVKVDYCKSSKEIAPLLEKLAKQSPPNGPASNGRGNSQGSHVPERTLTPIVCPECSGPIHFDATEKQYKCEVGHSYSLKTFSAAHTETLERVLWTAIRTLGERATLNEHLAERQRSDNPGMAERFRESAQSAERDAVILREVLDHLD